MLLDRIGSYFSLLDSVLGRWAWGLFANWSFLENTQSFDVLNATFLWKAKADSFFQETILRRDYLVREISVFYDAFLWKAKVFDFLKHDFT